MATTKPTQDQTLQSIYTSFQSVGLSNFAEGSAANMLAQTIASNITQLYDQITEAEDARDITTAQGDDLDNIARSYGIVRKPAVTSGSTSGANQMLLQNTTGTPLTVPAGTAVWSPSDVTTRFYTSSSVTVSANGSNSARVQAAQTGESKNAGVGTLTASNAPLGILVNNFLPIQGGSSQESDEEFRYRISETLQSTVLGGTTSNQGIKNIVLSQTGISDAIVQSAINGPGTLNVIIIPSAGFNLDDDFITTIEELVYANAAAGITVTVTGPTILYVDAEVLITISGDNTTPTAPITTLVQQTVQSYLNSLSIYVAPTPGQSTIPQNPNSSYLDYLTLNSTVVDAAMSILGNQLLNLNLLLSTATGQKGIQGNLYPPLNGVIRSRNIRVKTTSSN